MAALSGKSGNVKKDGVDVARVTKWTFNPSSNNPAWADSDTGGYKTRVAGVKDGKGSFDFKYDGAPPLAVGDAATLTLYMDGTENFSVPSIIDSLTYEVDINDGDVVGGSCEFSITAAWTEPT